MAIYKRLLTYNIPDHRHSSADVMKKTSTMFYEGPSKLIFWLTKDTDNGWEQANRIEEIWDADHMTERPMPLHVYQVEMDVTENDKHTMIAGLLYGGECFRTHEGAPPKARRLEISIGPEDELNSFVTDPTDPMEVYSKADLNENFYDPDTKQFKNLIYKEPAMGDRFTDDKIRSRRNHLLDNTDHKVAADDIPAEIKVGWEVYRQKLRDMPATWKDVPNELIPWVKSPEEHEPIYYDIKTDPEIISIEDRDEYDKKAMEQLWPIDGINENAPE